MRITPIVVASLALALGASLASAQGSAPAPDRDAQLEAARQQLEEAARTIAELTGGAFRAGQDFVRGLRGPAPRAVLGVGIEDDDGGVRVVSVTPGGGADAAGIETGDVITAMDGAALASGEGLSASEVLIAQMGNVDPGDTVALTILRDGDVREIEVEAQASRAQRFAFAPRAPGGGPHRGEPFMFDRPFGRWTDMELVELTPGLGAYFGTDVGVLVVRAPRDASLGLEDGDVILEIGGRTPMGVGHALRILGSFEPGERLELTIMREQRRRTLEVDIPGAERGD